MELREGMYVRTKKGKISKIKWITAQKWEGLENTVEASFMLENNENLEYPRDNFKASDNIIDLIEVGDYVNGYKVKAVYLKGYRKYIKLSNACEGEKGVRTYNEDIKSIVTKEMFNSFKYEVG